MDVDAQRPGGYLSGNGGVGFIDCGKNRQRAAAPAGKRPFRTVVDPSHDGADIGFAVIDRLRAEMLNRTDLSELLQVTA